MNTAEYRSKAREIFAGLAHEHDVRVTAREFSGAFNECILSIEFNISIAHDQHQSPAAYFILANTLLLFLQREFPYVSMNMPVLEMAFWASNNDDIAGSMRVSEILVLTYNVELK